MAYCYFTVLKIVFEQKYVVNEKAVTKHSTSLMRVISKTHKLILDLYGKIRSPLLSPIMHGSFSPSSSSLSPLAFSLTRSVFYSELKTWLFGKKIISSIDLFLSYRTDSTDSRTI